MSDLAQRINERLSERIHMDEAETFAEAIRQVLKLHQAVDVHNGWNPSGWCVECNDSGWDGALDGASPVPWPCPTVRRIASALGVREDPED